MIKLSSNDFVNKDIVRETQEGIRRDKQGNRLPTPYRCLSCKEDANYTRSGLWYCVTHWCELKDKK